MACKKYINVKDVIGLTGHPYKEILNLVNAGVLPAHKARKGHWRLNVDVVEKYFDVKINKPAKADDKALKSPERIKETKTASKRSVPIGDGETHLVTNESHYKEVIQRICAAESSIKIMTADFKRFRLKPTGYQGKDYIDGTPFVRYLMAKAVQGVSVQIICSRPSSTFTDEWKEYYQQLMRPTLFKYKFCVRNHAKVVIIDNQLAYIGSANITPAGLGQGIFTPGNYEAGIITEDSELVSSAKDLFSNVWSDKSCENCHRANNCN